MHSAAKVGGLVILFGGMTVGAYAVLQESLFAQDVKPYRVIFEDAGGLTAGSRVMMSGVKVGQVESIVLEAPGRAVAHIQVESKYQIPQGSKAVLPGSFISIGDKEVQIMPDSTSVVMLSENDEIPGELLGPLENMIPDTEETLENVNKTLVAIQDILSDKELTQGIKDVMTESKGMIREGQRTAASFGRLANTLDKTVAGTSGKVDQLLVTTNKSLMDMQVITAEIKELVVKGEFQDKTVKLLDELTLAVQQGKQLVSDMNALVADPEMRASMKTSMENVELMTGSGVRVASDMEAISKNGIVISEETAILLKKVNSLADDVQQLVENFQSTVGKIQGGGNNLLPKVGYEADMMYVPSDERARMDANLIFQSGKESYYLGLYDAFESNKLTLQAGRSVSDQMSLRYGVYASKPGVGVDYRVAPSLFLRGDLYGFNDSQLDLRLRYDFGGGVHGWAGMESIFDRNSLAVGLGMRR